MNQQKKKNNNEISTLNPNDSQGETPLDHKMIDQNPEPQDEEDMKDAMPEGLDLLGLEYACTRKYFGSIPPKHIKLL